MPQVGPDDRFRFHDLGDEMLVAVVRNAVAAESAESLAGAPWWRRIWIRVRMKREVERRLAELRRDGKDRVDEPRGAPEARETWSPGGEPCEPGVPTTREILALRTLERSVDERWVAWAVEMLVQGHDSPSLRILAGERAPYESPEIWALTDRVVGELGLTPMKDPQEAGLALAVLRARQVVERELSPAQAVADLKDLCIELGMVEELMDFYLLHFALDDLREEVVQFYWQGAERGNIVELIEERCRQFLEEREDAG